MEARLVASGTGYAGDPDPSNGPREWVYYEYDERGRVVSEHRSDGTTQTTTWEDCCHAKTTVSADGTETRYTSDILGRPTSVVQMLPTIGQQTSNWTRTITSYEYGDEEYESRDLPTVTMWRGYDTGTDIGGDIDSFTKVGGTRTIRDLMGRVVAAMQIDANGNAILATHHAYTNADPDNSTGRIVTTTRPAGQTEVRSYHLDGRLRSITGTGVVPQYFSYAVAAGEISRTVHTGVDQGPRQATTVTDMLGRTKREMRPGWATGGTATLTTTHTYDGNGDLEQVETHDGQNLVSAPPRHEIDRNGATETRRSGLDLDESGTLEPDYTDRYTKTETSRLNESPLSWDVTTVHTYATDNNDTATVLSTGKRLVLGFDNEAVAYDGTEEPTGELVAYSEVTDETGMQTQRWVYIDAVSQPPVRTVYEKRGTSNCATYARQQWERGFLVSATSHTGVTTTTVHDGLGRPHITSDGRTQITTNYDELGRVETRLELDGGTTAYEYYGQDELGAGQTKLVTEALGDDLEKKTRFAYDEFQRLTHTWGDTPQPTWVEYTTYDEPWKLHTYRADAGWTGAEWPAGSGDGDVTTWPYHPATGLLDRKEYAGGNGTDCRPSASTRPTAT